MVSQGCEDEWGFDAPGCMDMDAENYDVNATVDNDSCVYLSPTNVSIPQVEVMDCFILEEEVSIDFIIINTSWVIIIYSRNIDHP